MTLLERRLITDVAAVKCEFPSPVSGRCLRASGGLGLSSPSGGSALTRGFLGWTDTGTADAGADGAWGGSVCVRLAPPGRTATRLWPRGEADGAGEEGQPCPGPSRTRHAGNGCPLR